MARPLCGFSVRAHVDKMKFAAQVAMISFIVLAASPAKSDDLAQPVAEPIAVSTPAVDAEFLALPSFETEALDRSGSSAQDKARVGDQKLLKVSGLTLPGIVAPSKELKVVLPPGTDSLTTQGWSLGEVKPPQGAAQAGATEDPHSLYFTATVLKAGSITLPSLLITDNTGKHLGRTNPLSIEVQSSIRKDDPKPDKASDIAPPVGLAFPIWVVAAVGVLALILAGVAIFFIYRWWDRRSKMKPKVSKEPQAPPLTEDEAALKALDEIARLELFRQGQYKKHYFRVSEILKTYVGARYRFEAEESTSRELIRTLEEKKGLPTPVLDRIAGLFEKMDRVKFTDQVPNEGESRDIVAEARSWIIDTKRPPSLTLTPGAGPGALAEKQPYAP